MQDDDIIKKAKLIYWLFFLYVIVAVSAFMIWYFANISLGSGFRHLPSVTFLTAGVLSFIYYNSKKDNWVNDHFLWQRNTFIVMFVVSLILPLMVLFGLKTIPFLILIGLCLVISLAISIWFFYRIIKGYLSFKDEKTPYSSKR